MKISLSRKFEKMFKKCPSKIRSRCLKRLKMFDKDKHNPLLNNHALWGKLNGFRSINISGDYRVIFEEKSDEITLIAIGTHSQLFR